MTEKVYVNRTLNLRKIRIIGFDMDHTLVRYHSEAFEETTHRLVVERLIRSKKYPEIIGSFAFDYNLAIRGLVIDKRKGNLLKVSRHGAIRAAMHGTKVMDFHDQKLAYGSTYIDLRDSRYSAVDTAFSLSTASLFMQLVECKDSNSSLALPDYEQMANDLMSEVDGAHRDGSLKGLVRKDLDKYIIKDPDVVEGLEKYRKHGKRLFLLTNSDFNYTKLLLDYAIQPFLKDVKHWSDLFEFVITAAQKPRFFFDSIPFLKVDLATAEMTNQEGVLVPGIYQGGCAQDFTRDLQLDGDEILYLGDHIYGDILRLKKDCNWRTAMVIEDLECEVEKNKIVEPIQKDIEKLMNEKHPIEVKIVDTISEQIEKKLSKSSEVESLQKQIEQIDEKIGIKIRERQNHFNPYWGEVMRTGNEESYFAHQTERFACIYMTKLSDLLEMSPRTYFRAPRIPMPHEMS
ncbi:MAG: HAD-IG family 5'-nucleotidase [Oligoflexia bacterium]|nr:HAD-IG family 5'-nucleotidase [Oligoflexia bacterium]